MEPFELSPIHMINAQQERIMALVNENVQLTAAVLQLQQQLESANGHLIEKQKQYEQVANGEVELDPDAREYIKDVTDEVVGAEMDPKAEITS